jgi:hypothetical protein
MNIDITKYLKKCELTKYPLEKTLTLENNLTLNKLDELKRAIYIINLIKSDPTKGKLYEFKNGTVGLLKIQEGSTVKYKVYLDYKYPEKKHYNSPNKCKLCKLSSTRSWIDEYYTNNALSNNRGLSYNLTYYEYNTNTTKAEPTSYAMRQLNGKELLDQRILIIPYDHIPTMDHHEDCNINTKNFKPLGSYNHEKNTWNCGAYVYANSNDAEIILNLINIYKTAILFGKLRDNKIYKLATVDYDRNPGFYKYYKNNSPYTINNPAMYLLFHKKLNSEPHLHMHTFYDIDNDNFDKALQTFNLEKKTHFLNSEIDDYELHMDRIDNLIEQTKAAQPVDVVQIGGGNINFIEEIFGIDTSKLYNAYGHIFGDLLYTNTKDMLLGKHKYIKEKPWSDKNKVSSEYYDQNMDTAISFEHFFKLVLGVDENDEIMKSELIFPDPYFEDDIVENKLKIMDQFKLYSQSLQRDFGTLIYKDYEDNIKSFFDDKHYAPNNIGFNRRSTGHSFIKTTYDITTTENTISRDSTINDDNIMLLCLQFAFIHSPNIAGYYGHSAPVFNKHKQITHPEICLFNSVNYNLKLVKNAPYSNCNRNDLNNVEKYKNYQKILILYFIKFYNQYNRKVNVNNNIDQVLFYDSIIDSFFNQTTNIPQHGGEYVKQDYSISQIENDIKDIRLSQSKVKDQKIILDSLPIKQQDVDVKQRLYCLIGPEKQTTEQTTEQDDKLTFTIKDSEIKETLQKIIECINNIEKEAVNDGEEVKLISINEEEMAFLITTAKCLHFNIQPTNGQKMFLNEDVDLSENNIFIPGL